MALSNELISQFAKLAKDDKPAKKETTVYGTVVIDSGVKYVKIDGSDRLTPISMTADVKDNERVTVMIKNHTAIVNGNISSPAARTGDVQEVGNKITEVEILVADKVDTKQLNAQVARIDNLIAENATITNKLTAAEANIDNLEANNATITGKLTAAEADIDNLEVNKLSASVAEAKYATIENLDATNADIHNLNADYGTFKSLTTDKLTANEASINDLTTSNATITNKLTAAEADIDNLTAENATITGKLTAAEADIDNLKTSNATITGKLTAAEADIDNLEATKLSAESADLKYANIDFTNIGKAAIESFFSKSGMISDLVVGDTSVTGKLVGVTIIGDLIEGGTVKADKLVVLGSDGLYYKLNTDGVSTSAEQTEYNSLNGSVITAKSITAEKISVDDLVAFGATIGGFHITDNSIYSGVKESAINTTRGIYMDTDGQIAFGDTNRFIKFYKDQDGDYKLAVSADDISFGADNKNIKTAIDEISESVNNIQIGGRNLLLNSKFTENANKWTNGSIISEYVTKYGRLCAHIIKSESNQAIINMTQIMYGKLEPNASYTLSGWFLTENIIKGTTNPYAAVSVAGYYIKDGVETGMSLGSKAYNINSSEGSWEYLTLTFTTDDRISVSTRLFTSIYFRVLTGDIYFCDLKLEKGNKATDWTPAPEDIESRITSAETSITQNKNQISLRATKTEVTTAITNLEIGGRNYILNSANIMVDRLNATGSHAEYAKANVGQSYMNIKENTPLIFSFDLEMHVGTANPTLLIYNTNVACPKRLVGGSLTFEAAVGDVIKKRCSISTYLVDRTEPTETDNYIEFYSTYETGNVFKVTNMKLEMGDKATDWTPAPEDAESIIEDIDTRTTDSINDVQTKVEANMAAIDILIDKISMLVVGENGSTLYEQTDDGYTFNLATIKNSIDSASNNITVLSDAIDNIDGTTNNLQELVRNLENKTAYIQMKTDSDGNPCIELGKDDNPFKVRITNKTIDFLNGSSTVAYFNNKSLYIETAVIKNELEIGEGSGFSWKKRPNGNMGLQWIGGIN